MAIDILRENVSIHQTLGDEPNTDNGLSGDDLKARFDRGAEIIRDYINETVVHAVNNAATKSETAEAAAAEAKSIAESADQKAADALQKAGTAEGAAASAAQIASNASSYANSANDKAQQSMATASDAKQVADTALASAEGATNKAYEALRIANNVAQEMHDYSPSGTRAIAEAAMRTASSRLVAPESASVGQYFRVKEVDANGVVTAVEAVDLPSIAGSGLYDGAVFYNHISEITYEGEPTEDEIVPDEPEETIINLFDKNTMVRNGYLNTYNVAHTFTSNGIARFGTIPVEVGKTYSLSAVIDGTAKGISGASYGIYLLSDENTALHGTIAGTMKSYVDGAWTSKVGDFIFRKDNNDVGYTVSIPEGVAYVGIGLKNTAAATAELTDYYMFEEGTACHDYVAYSADGASGDDTPTETPDVSTQGNLAGCEITGLFGATLADTYARKNLSALAGKVEGMTGLSDDTIIDSGLRKFGYRIEPAQDDIPTVYANGDTFADMTTDKNEVKMSFKYISKTKVFAGWMKIKYQGNLSLWFDKKNFTVKLYGDKTMKRKLKVDLRGWGEQNKFVWKANYIDRSHARNIVSARLWSDMVASRPTYDARMMYSPNHGAIDGFPFRLYVNGEYYGLMTWNIPKDGWMAEMTEDNKNHCILCAELNGTAGTSSCDFAADFNSSAWSVEFPDEISNGLKYSFNDIIACVVNDSDEDFKANIDTHLDLYSALDYYLFFYLNGGTDSLAKNMLLMTFDGVKWYCGAYDMDGVWGRDAVSGAAMGTNFKCPEQYNNTNSLLWKRIEACFGQELRDRYFDLRETILSKEYIMAKFHQFVDQIPEEMYAEDVAKNTMRGVYGTEFLEEVSTWLDGRFAYVDGEMEAMAPATE